MNVLILDIDDDSFVQSLKNNNRFKVVTGTIRKPKLYPIPDSIILDFDEVFGNNDEEAILMEIAGKLHPQVTIVACSKEWNEGTQRFAIQFGVDCCCDVSSAAKIINRVYLLSELNLLMTKKKGTIISSGSIEHRKVKEVQAETTNRN